MASFLILHINIKVEPCSNSTHQISSITCAPDSQSSTFFTAASPKLQVYYKNLRIDPTKPTDKTKNFFIDNVFYYLDNTYLAVKNDIFVHDLSAKSYDDFFDSSAFQMDHGNYLSPVHPSILYQTPNDKEQLSVYFRRGQSLQRYTRKYYSIGDVAARLGGIWGLVAGSIGLIARMYNQIGYQKNLGDTIFQYENVKRLGPKKAKKKAIKSDASKLSRRTTIKDRYREFLTKAFNLTYKAFKSPFHYIFARVFCCFNKSAKLRIDQQERGLFLARHKLDVLFLLRKLQELEKIKYALFDKNQRMLFEYIPPSNLGYNPERKKLTEKTNEEEKKVTKSDVMDALKYYDPRNELESHFRFKNTDAILELYYVYKRIQKNTVNQRLISLLGFRVLSLFRYLDHVISPEENKDIQRTRGVMNALRFFKGLLEKIRKRKEETNNLEKVHILNWAENEEEIHIPGEDKNHIKTTDVQGFGPDITGKFKSIPQFPSLFSLQIKEKIGNNNGDENPLKNTLTRDKISDESVFEDKINSNTKL